MSYDISICVKIEGLDQYAEIGEPEYAHPTYNIGSMLRAAMDWDYSQCEKDENGNWHDCYYKCDFVIGRVEQGIRELRTNPQKYKKYEPENGWGSIGGALEALESLRACIYEFAERIPIEHLYMCW